MPSSRPNPTASRRALAARLRRMRLAAGKSTEDAARELMVSASKISRLESGERAPQPRDVRDLARFFGATDDEIEQLQILVVESRRKGWWAHYSTWDEQSEVFLGLETAASRIEAFESVRWPGLLQTAEVARAVFESIPLPSGAPLNFVDDQVKIRLERQERLLDGELAMHVIMDETIFHRPLGAGVVERQVVHLIELCESLQNLQLQIVPQAIGLYPGMDGAFWILREQEALGASDVVFIEGLLGHNVVDRVDAVNMYENVFSLISTNYALSKELSLGWLSSTLA